MITELIPLAVVIQIALFAAAWGDMRREIRSNREIADERHHETQARLISIADDVRRINGTVARHDNDISRIREGH